MGGFIIEHSRNFGQRSVKKLLSNHVQLLGGFYGGHLERLKSKHSVRIKM